MKTYKFRILLHHNGSKRFVHLDATDQKSAIKSVMKSEGCPWKAVREAVNIGESNRFKK